MEEHVKTGHKKAFHDGVIEWLNGFIKWKGS